LNSLSTGLLISHTFNTPCHLGKPPHWIFCSSNVIPQPLYPSL
jgi:hypothetical protein